MNFINPENVQLHSSYSPKRHTLHLHLDDHLKKTKPKEIKHHENIVHRSPYQKLIHDTKVALEQTKMSYPFNYSEHFKKFEAEGQTERAGTSFKNRKQFVIRNQMRTISPFMRYRQISPPQVLMYSMKNDETIFHDNEDINNNTHHIKKVKRSLMKKIQRSRNKQSAEKPKQQRIKEIVTHRHKKEDERLASNDAVLIVQYPYQNSSYQNSPYHNRLNPFRPLLSSKRNQRNNVGPLPIYELF